MIDEAVRSWRGFRLVGVLLKASRQDLVAVSFEAYMGFTSGDMKKSFVGFAAIKRCLEQANESN